MTQTSTNQLKFEWAFADGDTRIFNLKYPLENQDTTLTTKIEALNSYMLDHAFLVGDKAAGAFTGIYRASVVTQTTTQIDFT